MNKDNTDMKTFESLGVAPMLLKAIQELGFETPMPIQAMVIPHLLEQQSDVVGLAQTGTGKTAAFGLPVLQRIDTSATTQALIIAPTRELCLQIAGDLADFAKYLDAVRILPVYGGSSIESQIRALRKGVQIIVATPGRLIDLIERGEVKLGDVHTVILDEADEMLNMGFLDDINQILTHVPSERKMLMFSATMPREIAEISRRFMTDPVEFVAGNRNEGATNVKHIYYMVKAQDKYLALKRVADNNPDIYGIVFCRTRKETQEIADKLIADGYNADCLHGDLSQAMRDLAMKKFRDHVTQLLVATDVAARGLDVDDLTHVVNYGLPEDTAVYTHRSGRTGRAGKTGVSVAIIHSREKGRLKDIEKKLGKTFEYKKVPSPEHIIEKQLYHLADQLERVAVNEQDIAPYLPGVIKKLEWLTGEDLLKRVLSLEFNRLLAYYRDLPDIDLNADNKPSDKPRKEARKRAKSAEPGMASVFINVGKKHGFYPRNLMDLVNQNVSGHKPSIGHIALNGNYSVFDVPQADAVRVSKALRGADFYGQRIYAEPFDPDKNYKEMTERKRGKKPSEKKGEKKGEKKAAAKESQKKPKAEKKAEKAKYHGNYDIFIKK